MTAHDTNSIRSYYDAMSRQFLVDYVHGNPRVERAISHVLRWLPPATQRVLDIGCGIGWSTFEISRANPTANVTGIDLSPASIDIAHRLFDGHGTTFACADVTDPRWSPGQSFNAIVMIDVYEHIPPGSRRSFNRALRALLEDGARILLTFPSAAHQAHLAEDDPNGLQPIDETITRELLEELAADVDGTVLFFQPVTIWRPGDYVHAAIQRGGAAVRPLADANWRPQSRIRRARLVLERLSIEATRDGYLIPRGTGPSIMIVAPKRNVYSETFIKAQIEGLPADVQVLFGLPPDSTDANGRPLVPRWARRVRRVAERVFGRRVGRRIDSYWFGRHVRRHSIRAVVAEYGPTGATLLDVCQQHSVPLVTCFYGFDASRSAVLARMGASYARLFRAGQPLVVVSRDMERRMVALGAKPACVHYIASGVDTERFSGALPAANPPVFLAIGRFIEKKAPHLTILAFKSVLVELPDAELWLVGDGPLLDACRQLAHALGMAASVRFLGPRPHHELPDLYRRARAFVQHSVVAPNGDMEGTPVAILEAEAAGLPVVATRHGGICEAVVDGETGYLVDEGDLEAMAGRMATIGRDAELAGRLGLKAREHVTRDFQLSDGLEHLWSVIADAISSSVVRDNVEVVRDSHESAFDHTTDN